LEQFKPQIIYTHHHGDINIDHRITVEAVEAAVRPMKNISVEKVFSFEIPSSTEWNFIKSDFFRPNVFNSISQKSFNKKLKAFSAYKDEIRHFPHPRSIEYVSALAKIRGGDSGFELAEAFMLVFEREL
jgi:LmbE family N-acetylglucosaminyl deacetylase